LIGIDYLTMTGPSVRVEDLENDLRAAFPLEEPRTALGRRGYTWRLTWSTGAELNGGGPDGRWWLVLSGVTCGVLGLERTFRLLTSYYSDSKITRIDLRRDLRGERITLLEDLEAACHRGELCRARKFKRFDEREAVGIDRTGYGIYLGSTSSPCFVRAYDKGLESGHSPAGTWVRFEAQLRGDHAQAAAQSLEIGGLDHFARTAGKILGGLVDFREGDRSSVDNLNDLPQPDFWVRFLDSYGSCRLDLPPVDRSLATWMEHYRRTLGGVLTLAAQHAGMDLGLAAALVLEGSEPTDGTKENPIVQPLASWLMAQLQPSM
jgi:hypothetical protein